MPCGLAKLAVYVMASSLLLASCTSLRAVHVPPADARWQQVPDIQVGDSVVVILKDGRKEAFRVTSVGTAAVYGKTRSISYADIETLQIRKFNGKRTAWLVLGTLAGVAVVSYGALLAALSQEED
jgi:hypothetical protein